MIEVFSLAGEVVQVAVARKEKPEPLGIVIFGDACEPAEIDWRAFKSLDPGQACQPGAFQQRNRAKEPAVQAVVRVPPFETFAFTPGSKRIQGRYNNFFQ